MILAIPAQKRKTSLLSLSEDRFQEQEGSKLLLGTKMMVPSNGRDDENAVGGASTKLRHVAAFEDGGLLGLAAASTAITTLVAVSKPPPWLHRDAYFVALSGAFFAGVTQVIASVRAADAAGRKLTAALYVVPFVVAVGISVASLLGHGQ